jgi:hypothetical protein
MTAAVLPAVDPSLHKQRLNELTFVFGSPEEHASAEPIAFVCECGSAECFGTVWLTPSEYEAQLQQTRPRICRPGH